MNLTKHERVKLLLLTRDDYIPSPPIATGKGSAPGPQASRYVKCEPCAGSGRLRGTSPCMTCVTRKANGKKTQSYRGRKHGCRMCAGCDGTGERRRQRGDESYDTYSGMTLEELESQPAETRPASKRLILQDIPDREDAYAWEIDKARLYAQGSYAELDAALAWLEGAYPFRYELLSHWVSSQGDSWWSWSKSAEASVDETIRVLASRMPQPVRVPGQVLAWRRRVAA